MRLNSSAEDLLKQAQITTGIHDIEDTDIEARLQRLVASLNEEAQLNERGAEAMEQRLLRILANRLRMLRDCRDHPEITQQPIKRPLIMTGGPRTGSTKLQKMLAASGDFLWMPFWQGYSMSLRGGDRGENTDARIQDAANHLEWFYRYATRARLAHEFSTFEPEEENLLLEHCLFPPYLMAFVMVPGYAEWALPRGFKVDYEFLRRALQYLQWQFHDGDQRSWLLKSPGYIGQEHVLAQVFPDAAFVTTHRDPVQTIASGASLVASMHLAHSDEDRLKLFAQNLVEQTPLAMQMHMDICEQYPELNILEIGYRETVESASQVVNKIYKHAGMTLSDESMQRMMDWQTDNGQHKRGVHKYSLEECGLTPDIVRERFASYYAQFGDLL